MLCRGRLRVQTGDQRPDLDRFQDPFVFRQFGPLGVKAADRSTFGGVGENGDVMQNDVQGSFDSLSRLLALSQKSPIGCWKKTVNPFF